HGLHPLHRRRRPLGPESLPVPGGTPTVRRDRHARSRAALSAREGSMSTLVADATATPTPTALPPGPRTPGWWQSLRFALWPYATVASGPQRWGERFTVRAFGQSGKMVIFTDPEGIKDIFTADGDDLRSGEPAAPILGPTLRPHSLLL